MGTLHTISTTEASRGLVNEVIIGGVRYVPEDQQKIAEEKLITKIVEQVVYALGNSSQATQYLGVGEAYTLESVENLCDEKTANEILATLFDRMPSPHPSRLRPSYEADG